MRICVAHYLGSYAQGQVCNQVRGQNLVSAIKTTEANLTKLHRKIEHNENVRRSVRPLQIVLQQYLINY